MILPTSRGPAEFLTPGFSLEVSDPDLGQAEGVTLFDLAALNRARDVVRKHMPATPQYRWPLEVLA